MSDFLPTFQYPPACRVLISDSSNKFDGVNQDWVAADGATTKLVLRPGRIKAYELRDAGYIHTIITGNYTQGASATTMRVQPVVDGVEVGSNSAVATPAVTTTGTGFFVWNIYFTPVADEGASTKQLLSATLTVADSVGVVLAGGGNLACTGLHTVDMTAAHTFTYQLYKSSTAGSILDVRSIHAVVHYGATGLL